MQEIAKDIMDMCVYMSECVCALRLWVYGWVCVLRLLVKMKTAHPCSDVSHYCSLYSAKTV